MADWRQIQARIRKAKNSPEAHAKLSELFQRTRDAMVAWELGGIEEKAEHRDEAGRWYAIAAQRFRRADWKKKAEEALTRLGLELPTEPVEIPAPPRPARAAEETGESLQSASSELHETHEEQPQLAPGEIPGQSEAQAGSGNGQAGPEGKRKRRRGRRGGRGRRRRGGAAQPGLPAQAFAESGQQAAPQPEAVRASTLEPSVPFEPTRPTRVEPPPPQLPSERAAHGRGDPALASRMAHLESLLRRLVSSPLHRVDEAGEAPAGPGVLLLSDSDQVTSYYVEACQTLRIGLANLVRGGRGGKGGRGGRGYPESGLKAKLAEHLGINEAKVSQYLKDHCVVRWIQLDDEAPHLAHFAIGVLRTPLNLD